MPGEGVDYLLDLLSRINKENGVTTRDNGVSQEVEARQHHGHGLADIAERHGQRIHDIRAGRLSRYFLHRGQEVS